MSSQIQSNKETTLADALAKIETLTAENTKLTANLETANASMKDLEDKLNTSNASLKALENTHRDIDKEVSIKVAEIASKSGVSPIANTPENNGEESLEELAKRIENARGIEKAKLIETNAERIIRTLRGVV